AAIVHLHAREPKDGRPTQDPAMFMRFLPKIRAASNVVINLTTGGAPTMTVEERLRPAAELKPEVASLNMGSMNFGLYEMLGRYKDFKYDWEKPYLAGSDDRIFKSTFKDIDTVLETFRENDTRFEIECYDIGHLYTIAHFLYRSLVRPPLSIQSVSATRVWIGQHRAFPGSRPGAAAALHQVGVRHPRRDRPAPRGRDAHEAYGRPALRRPVLLVGARRRPQPDVRRRHVGRDGRQRARGAGGQPLARPRPAREDQRRAGHQGAPHHRGTRPRRRHSRRRARDAEAQGPQPRGVLSARHLVRRSLEGGNPACRSRVGGNPACRSRDSANPFVVPAKAGTY